MSEAAPPEQRQRAASSPDSSPSRRQRNKREPAVAVPGYVRTASFEAKRHAHQVAVPGFVRTASFEAKRRHSEKHSENERYLPPESGTTLKPIPSASCLIEPTEEEQRVSRKYFVFLLLFAWWSQFKPSEPFLVNYLVDEKGLTGPTVYNHVFDLFIYARMPCVLIVGILSWSGSSRKILIGGAACGTVTVLLTRFGTQLAEQQFAQFTVAAAFSSRVVCPAMAIALTASPAGFQQSVHMLKAVVLMSNCASAVSGEFLRDYFGIPLKGLFDLSMIGQAISFCCALMLPEQGVHNKQGDSSSEEDGDGNAAGTAGGSRTQSASGTGRWMVKELISDLRQSLQLRTVQWWTAWALTMNPVHGITMTYWQGLVRSKNILSDHNGAFLSCMYLIAAVFTLVSGASPTLRSHTSLFAIGSMLAGGLLLMHIVLESYQLPIYATLLTYQCLFEVMTAVGTFQVGAAVTEAGSGSRGAAIGRLTMLFSVTSVTSGVIENVLLFCINGHDIEYRFVRLGCLVLVVASLLMLLRGVEECALRKTAMASEIPHSADDASTNKAPLLAC